MEHYDLVESWRHILGKPQSRDLPLLCPVCLAGPYLLLVIHTLKMHGLNPVTIRRDGALEAFDVPPEAFE